MVKRTLTSMILLAAVLLALSPRTASAAFSGINGRIAFTTYYGFTEQCPPGADWSSNPASYEALFSMNPGGSDARQVTGTQHRPPYCFVVQPPDFAFDRVPSYAPDGKRLAFNQSVANSAGSNWVEVEVTDADGTNRHLLARVPSNSYTSKPAFSPNGSWIAFVDGSVMDGPPTSWITVIRRDGTHKRRITQETVGRTDVHPVFFPGGKRIVFASHSPYTHPALPSSISTVRFDGSHRHTLVTGPVDSPDVSPDGSRIVFNRTVGDRKDIYVMWADGTHQRLLAHGSDPVFSPNGNRIAFSSATRYPNFDMDLGKIIVMMADGFDKHALIPNPLPFGVIHPAEFALGQPTWGPRP